MAHLSLYRKYRPQSFSEVVGQEHVTRTLQRAVTQKRLAHALLFSGPRGTGKTSTARILAKALNCERAEGEPCGDCSSCEQIRSGVSLDVVEIDAASHGSVDDARDLREKVAYSTVGGRWKVYIIDECHMLSPAANNALLKVLEEPPDHVVFVFATTEPYKVLQTVQDRCQRYEFRAVSAIDAARRLAQVCEMEGIRADEQTQELIASRAGGSVRDALSMLDQLRSFAGDDMEVGDLTQLLGRMPDDLLFEAVDIVSERDVGAVFVFAERLVRSGVDLREFARGLTDHLRSLFLVLNVKAAREILEVTDNQLTRLQEQANRFQAAELLRLLDLTNEIQLQLRQAVPGRLVLEIALARMARPELHATPASLLARLERLEAHSGPQERAAAPVEPAKPKAAPVEPAKPKAAPVEDPTVDPVAKAPQEAQSAETPEQEGAMRVSDASELDIAQIERAWPVILEKVKRRKISLHAMLHPAHPAAWQGHELILEFGPRSRFHRDKVSEEAQNAPLAEAFEQVLGVKPKIKCVMGTEASSARPAKRASYESEGPEEDEPSDSDSSEPAEDAVELIHRAFKGTVVVDDP
ncbi:MAG: DNA polymerase III subunit gamma/tau [Actinobacteria bacterium]|nr:DNA polymerase III subunit gamma/tau [Actinomycetota bacterium]